MFHTIFWFHIEQTGQWDKTKFNRHLKDTQLDLLTYLSVVYKVRSVSVFSSSFFHQSHSKSGPFLCSPLHSFISPIQGQVSFCVHSFISLSFNTESHVCFCVTFIPSKFTSKVISVCGLFSSSNTFSDKHEEFGAMTTVLAWQPIHTGHFRSQHTHLKLNQSHVALHCIALHTLEWLTAWMSFKSHLHKLSEKMTSTWCLPQNPAHSTDDWIMPLGCAIPVMQVHQTTSDVCEFIKPPVRCASSSNHQQWVQVR